jgi:hypothetical protein
LNTYFTQKNKSEQLYQNDEVFEDLIDSNRKMCDIEKYYKDADQGETLHITKYIVKTQQDVKTLDVKIFELREKPDDIQLLLDVLSIIVDQEEEILQGEVPIKDFELVNYILANALKADVIRPDDLGLVLTYLEVVQAPSIFFQYAILRVHQNLPKVKLIDIAMSLQNGHHLIEMDKIEKLCNRIQNHIEVTHEKLLCQNGFNLKGLMGIYNMFSHYRMGSMQFFKKLEGLIEKDLVRKEYQL